MSSFPNIHGRPFFGWYLNDRFLCKDDILGRFRISRVVKGRLPGPVLSRTGLPPQFMLTSTRDSFVSYDITKYEIDYFFYRKKAEEV
jgi:hypothetical protein